MTSFDKVVAQVEGFRRGRQRAEGNRDRIKLSMLIMAFVTEDRRQTMNWCSTRSVATGGF